MKKYLIYAFVALVFIIFASWCFNMAGVTDDFKVPEKSETSATNTTDSSVSTSAVTTASPNTHIHNEDGEKRYIEIGDDTHTLVIYCLNCPDEFYTTCMPVAHTFVDGVCECGKEESLYEPLVFYTVDENGEIVGSADIGSVADDTIGFYQRNGNTYFGIKDTDNGGGCCYFTEAPSYEKYSDQYCMKATLDMASEVDLVLNGPNIDYSLSGSGRQVIVVFLVIEDCSDPAEVLGDLNENIDVSSLGLLFSDPQIPEGPSAE